MPDELKAHDVARRLRAFAKQAVRTRQIKRDLKAAPPPLSSVGYVRVDVATIRETPRGLKW